MSEVELGRACGQLTGVQRPDMSEVELGRAGAEKDAPSNQLKSQHAGSHTTVSGPLSLREPSMSEAEKGRAGSASEGDGGDLREVSHDPTLQRSNVTAIRRAADAFGVVVAISIMILFQGIWSSRKIPWEQPRAPRRAFEFARFESCRAVQEGFNAQVRLGASDSLLADPGVRPYSDFWYPLYESDYCEYCNCSASSPEPMMLYDVYMMAAPVAMAAEGGMESAARAPSPPPSPPSAAQDYTGTNNQVDGVDEADVIKTDGTYLYVIPRSGASLVISQVFPANSARILSRVNLTQYNLRASDALLDKNVLAVIGSSNVRNAAGTLFLSMAAVHLFDVTDRSNPRLKLAYELEGNSLTARLLNGFVYVVVSTWPTYTGSRRAGTPPASRRKSVVSSDSLPYSPPALRTFAPLKRTLTEREANLDTATAVRVVPVCECEDISYIKNLGTVSGWITVVALSTAGGQFDATVDARDQVAIKTSTHAGRGEAAMMSSGVRGIVGLFFPCSRSLLGMRLVCRLVATLSV
jgi:hypothetical protein